MYASIAAPTRLLAVSNMKSSYAQTSFQFRFLLCLADAYRDASIVIDYEIRAVMRYPVRIGHRGAPKSQNIIQRGGKSLEQRAYR